MARCISFVQRSTCTFSYTSYNSDTLIHHQLGLGVNLLSWKFWYFCYCVFEKPSLKCSAASPIKCCSVLSVVSQYLCSRFGQSLPLHHFFNSVQPAITITGQAFFIQMLLPQQLLFFFYTAPCVYLLVCCWCGCPGTSIPPHGDSVLIRKKRKKKNKL